MKYTTIRIEGPILSSDILDKIEVGELGGQKSQDFGLENTAKVKDEIARAWADAHDLWRIFCRQKERLEKGSGTTETRKYWILPLLGILGYDAEIAKAEEVSGKNYAISHRAKDMDGFPIHIMGFNDSLDKKREEGGPRMSPHALVQEYLNITEHLYAIVTNGIQLRLLRDSSRLIKLSFIEFDLKSMMEEEHFADFAIMYRLLHASRMPKRLDGGAESLIEKYHQDALDSGSRIREGLCEAVETSIKTFAEGFLNHPANIELRAGIESKSISAEDFYHYQLRLIYRLLFLMVIEERNLIYPKSADTRKVRIYYDYYSVGRLRSLCEKVVATEKGNSDLWQLLKNTFKLFEKEYFGKALDVKPLAGDLFGPNAIGTLSECRLDNAVLLECLRNLSIFTNKNNNQKMRVNYASLNVEEFGSVYEGLLEYDPVIEKPNGRWHFIYKEGEGRSSSGSHYTEDELVQPLIKHSLEYIIEDKLKSVELTPGLDEASRKRALEKALLSIRVLDDSCGSGHILLSAARRIGTELARVRTGEDQPSPVAFREAVRDVIRHCIYGVDKNPLAVELCKVALWLEAHNPGEPLNFLDHHIKCGDAIVGLAHKEELQKGIAEEAFKRLPTDVKDVCAELRKKNAHEKKAGVDFLKTGQVIDHSIVDVLSLSKKIEDMPENTPEQVEEKQREYKAFTTSHEWWTLKNLADIQIAQFFIPKTPENKDKIITEGQYWLYLTGRQMIGPAVAEAMSVATKKRFFHWFLEFPEVFEQGGFDCLLGNPPFLGGQRISGNFGDEYLSWLKWLFEITGSCDLVTYFFRRNFTLLKNDGFFGLISTNSISQGTAREGGLEKILKMGGDIVFAIPSQKWPGVAAVEVSLLTIRKGLWNGIKFLGSKKVNDIDSHLSEGFSDGEPFRLSYNGNFCARGATVVGPGFILTFEEATRLLSKSQDNSDVVFPYLNGSDLNSFPNVRASRFIISFFDWPLSRAKGYSDCLAIVEEKVKPYREENQYSPSSVEKWWQYYRPYTPLFDKIKQLRRIIVVAQVSKTLGFAFVSPNQVIDIKLIVFSFETARHFAVLQSNIHSAWAWRFCTTLKTDLSYGNERIFDTFSFPGGEIQFINDELEFNGEFYHQFRRSLMELLQCGLTKTYNLFHTRDLSPAIVASVSKQPLPICEQGYNDIIKLRELHKEMDLAVLSAYGWSDIDLRHDFYEVDYLPENDRVRHTIHPDARREVLKRLLKLNHERHEEEVKAGLWEKKKPAKSKASQKEKDTANVQKPEVVQLSLLAPPAPTGIEDSKSIPFRIVQPKHEDRYKTCVPIYDIKAAAGPFGEYQQPAIKFWMEIEGIPINNRLFVVQVIGDSMEPDIAKGSYCLFEKIFLTPTHGKILFVQYREEIDPETGGKYAVKKCEMVKATDDFGDAVVRTRLVSINPKYPPKELESGDEIVGMAKFVGVLGNLD